MKGKENFRLRLVVVLRDDICEFSVQLLSVSNVCKPPKVMFLVLQYSCTARQDVQRSHRPGLGGTRGRPSGAGGGGGKDTEERASRAWKSSSARIICKLHRSIIGNNRPIVTHYYLL